MLAIAPGTARAVLVMPVAASLADHGLHYGWPRVQPAQSAGGQLRQRCQGLTRSVSRKPAQAALARRIRRRRSEERSSSLRPPQVPYFSGLLTA